MFEFLSNDVSINVGFALACIVFLVFFGFWLRGSPETVYAIGERAPRKTPQIWKLAQQVRDGENLPALAEELDDICGRFRHVMCWGENIYDAHPESDDRKMFRKILDEGWEVYEKFDKESSHA